MTRSQRCDASTSSARRPPSAFYLKLNTKMAPTDDIHIRKAIACATDYETIRDADHAGRRAQRAAAQGVFADYVPTTCRRRNSTWTAPRRKSRKSKYAGKTIPITLQYVSGTKFEEDIALLMQSNLEQLGFKVTAQPDPWNRVTELATKLETSPTMSEIFFGPTYPSPDSMFFTQYDCKAAGTWASLEWLQDPDIDALIDKARGTGDAAEQATIYKDLQHKLVDMQPDVFLETQTVQHAMDKCLTGFKYSADAVLLLRLQALQLDLQVTLARGAATASRHGDQTGCTPRRSGAEAGRRSSCRLPA